VNLSRRYQRGESDAWASLSFIPLATAFAAWITHIIFCFEHDRWGFLIAGALFFPVAIVHGVWLWFQ
jgi:hypothetical protein